MEDSRIGPAEAAFMVDLVFAYITAPNAETADRIARDLVDKRLAACVNVIPGMRSTYRWEGAITQGEEWVLIAKTRAGHMAALTACVRDRHPDQTPCVVAIPLSADHGAHDFLAWAAEETAPGNGGD